MSSRKDAHLSTRPTPQMARVVSMDTIISENSSAIGTPMNENLEPSAPAYVNGLSSPYDAPDLSRAMGTPIASLNASHSSSASASGTNATGAVNGHTTTVALPNCAPHRQLYHFNSTGSFGRTTNRSSSQKNLKSSIVIDCVPPISDNDRIMMMTAIKTFEGFAGKNAPPPEEFIQSLRTGSQSQEELFSKMQTLYSTLYTLSRGAMCSSPDAQSNYSPNTQGLLRSPYNSGHFPVRDSRWGSVDSTPNAPTLVERCGATYGTDDIGNDTINEYTVLADLGRGAYGKVQMACDEVSQKIVAIKTMNKGLKIKGHNDPVALREIAVMKKLRHKNIVPLLEVIDDEEEGVVHLVMEYVNQGPILRPHDDGTWPTLSEEKVRTYIRQMIAGLQYLHNHGVVHRDIKPDNILTDSDGHLYLVDFGVSEILEKNNGSSNLLSGSTTQQVGTFYFFSPEMCSGATDEDGIKSDVWALGVMMYLMLFGRLPFGGSRPQEIMSNIEHQPLTFPDSTSMVVREALEGLLDKDPANRLTLRKLRSHPFTTDLGTLPMEASMSTLSQRTRPSSSSVMTRETDSLTASSGSVIRPTPSSTMNLRNMREPSMFSNPPDLSSRESSSNDLHPSPPPVARPAFVGGRNSNAANMSPSELLVGDLMAAPSKKPVQDKLQLSIVIDCDGDATAQSKNHHEAFSPCHNAAASARRKSTAHLCLTPSDLHGAVRRRRTVHFRHSRSFNLSVKAKKSLSRYVKHIQTQLQAKRERRRQSSATVVDVTQVSGIAPPASLQIVGDGTTHALDDPKPRVLSVTSEISLENSAIVEPPASIMHQFPLPTIIGSCDQGNSMVIPDTASNNSATESAGATVSVEAPTSNSTLNFDIPSDAANTRSTPSVGGTKRIRIPGARSVDVGPVSQENGIE